MIRGINNQPFLDLDAWLDIEGFKNLHYEMCYGLAVSSWKKEGNIVKPGGCDQYDPSFKPIFKSLEEYFSLPEDHEIRKYGKIIGELDNRNTFINFLKLSLGAYDPYQFIFLKTEDGGWQSRFQEKQWTPDSENFPNLKKWIEKLIEDRVFQHLGRIIFFKAEHDVIMPKHRDLILPHETEYTDHRHEFIHIRSTMDKKFYIWDNDIDVYHYVNCYSCFFNDQDWHGGEANDRQTFSLRIDGRFTDEFRQKIGISHLSIY